MTSSANVNERVLARLKKHAVEIRDLDRKVLDQEIRYKPNAWEERLARFPAALEVLRDHPDGLTRRDVAAYAERVRHRPSEAGFAKLFVASQIWGTGTGDNRGPFRTQEALSDSRRAGELERIFGLVADGTPGEGYVGHLNRWGRSFISKYLYFSALAFDDQIPTALILDQLVWNTLDELGWSSREAAGTNRWVRRYEAYVEAMHGWARAIRCRPDTLEMWMWNRGKP